MSRCFPAATKATGGELTANMKDIRQDKDTQNISAKQLFKSKALLYLPTMKSSKLKTFVLLF